MKELEFIANSLALVYNTRIYVPKSGVDDVL